MIISGDSDRQLSTIAEEVVRSLKESGSRPVRREGEAGARWLLLDFVDFVVHVFHREERDYYSLERLWRDAPTIAWTDEREASSG